MDRYERAEALLDLIESDFGQSDRFVRLEAIRCEFEAMAKRIKELECLVDGAMEVVELFGDTDAQIYWREMWLKKARKLFNEAIPKKQEAEGECLLEEGKDVDTEKGLYPTVNLRWYRGELQQWWDSNYVGERGEWRDVVHYR